MIVMKYICDPKYGYHEFETADECLRFEGAREAEMTNEPGNGFLWFMLFITIIGVIGFG